MKCGLITVDCDVLGECIDFVDCVSTGQQDEPDVGGGSWLLYLQEITNLSFFYFSTNLASGA